MPALVGGLSDTILLLERAGPTVDPEVLSLLAEACDGRRILTFGYTSRASDHTERISRSTALVERLDARRTRISLGASSLVGLAAWIASFEIDFEVVSPPEMLDVLHELRVRIDSALGA